MTFPVIKLLRPAIERLSRYYIKICLLRRVRVIVNILDYVCVIVQFDDDIHSPYDRSFALVDGAGKKARDIKARVSRYSASSRNKR